MFSYLINTHRISSCTYWALIMKAVCSFLWHSALTQRTEPSATLPLGGVNKLYKKIKFRVFKLLYWGKISHFIKSMWLIYKQDTLSITLSHHYVVSYLLFGVCDNANMLTSECWKLFYGTMDLKQVMEVLYNPCDQNSCTHCLNMYGMAHSAHLEDLKIKNSLLWKVNSTLNTAYTKLGRGTNNHYKNMR
jgi:hypothetical protein